MSSGFSSAPTTAPPPKGLKDAADASWVRRIAETVNALLRGRLNVTLSVTLTANAGTTTIKDARIGPFSALIFEPLTANAAAALYASPYVLVSSQQNGQAVVAHVNDANTDKDFRLTILA